MKFNDALNLLKLAGSNITVSDIDAAFRKLSMAYHPDRNPAGLEMMKLINNARDTLKRWITEQGESVTFSNTQESDYHEEILAAIQVALGLEGLTLEICGNWLWIDGDTKPHAKTLKAAKFRYASKKVKWYFRPAEYRSRSRASMSMDQIRDYYGSKEIRNDERKERIAA